jgi:CRP-like cAMP-binding protein
MAYADDVSKIARIPLFASLEPEALRLIAMTAEILEISPGAVIFARGERSDGGCLVLSGTVGLFVSDYDVDPVVVVEAGSLIGELALFTATDRPATAKALDSVRIAKITRGAFKRVLQEHPSSSAQLRAVLAQRLTGFIDDLQSFDALS